MLHLLLLLMATTQRVAIIGGGISGLSCAKHLSKRNYEVTVFDTGRLRPGGRASSRLPNDRPKESTPTYNYLSKGITDHAAQMIVPSSSDFQGELDAWKGKNIVTQFPEDSIFSIGESIKPLNIKAYYGSQTQGMYSVVDAMNDGSFKLEQDVWVSPSNGARFKNGKWYLQASGEKLGVFDKLIIAHNGKCADRLMSKTPAKDVHSLLQVNFASSVPKHGGKKMTLNSIYSLTIALAKGSELSRALPSSFMAGFVRNEPSLRFLSCQSRKYPTVDDFEVWTLLSSATFAKKHKAPQEFLPEETVETVSDLMLRAIESAVKVPENSVKPLESRLQLWGAALPLNHWENGKGFVYDADHSVGVCGDWLVESSIGGSWTSGKLLAEYLNEGGKTTVGLEGQFERLENVHKDGIGSLTFAPAKVVG